MTYQMTRLPVDIPGAADFVPLTEATTAGGEVPFGYEFRLRTDSGSLTSRGNGGAALTPQGTAPTYTADHALIDTGVGNALSVPFLDYGQAVTMWGVFSIPPGTASVVEMMGNDNADTAGRGVWRSSGGLLRFRVNDQITTAGMPAVPTGAYVWIGFSSDPGAATPTNLIMPGGLGAAGALLNTGEPVGKPAVPFGFGNAAYVGAHSSVAMATPLLGYINHRAATAEELHAIYLRNVAQLAAEGYTVTAFS